MNFEQAAARWEAAKIAHARTGEELLAAERDLLQFASEKDEGAVSVRQAGWKLTVTYRVNRTVDEAALSSVSGQLSREIFERVFRFKPAVVMEGLRYLQSNEPELYAIAAQAITATPGKPSVTLERVVMKEAA